MIQRIIKDMCILLASALYGIIIFLQIPKGKLILDGKCLNFFSSKDFQYLYKDPHLRAAEFITLKYDNIFLWVFGIFLITYIFTLKSINSDEKRTKNIHVDDKRKINIILYVLLFMSIGYIISDWWENHLLCEMMSKNDVIVTGLPYLSKLKWLLALISLISCLIIDKKYFNNNFNISYRISMCLGIILVVIVALAIHPYIIGLLAKMNSIKYYAMSTLFD
ncbi:hypothetical protein GCM10023210_03280 [Chryseobacterium ginsengisoli]|uniref:Uncharacterized protein n=1 Tax=Chryseobacterium ginsengisoli TaxID=363853 RepID=A0ABP9LW22_9FLAO